MKDYDNFSKKAEKGQKLELYIRISYSLSDFLHKRTTISPLQVSLINIIIGFLMGFLVTFGHFILAGVLLFSYSILDHIDGSLARKKGIAGKPIPIAVFGSWADTVGHFVLLSSLFIGMAFYLNTWFYSFVNMMAIFIIDTMKNKFIKKGGKIAPAGKRGIKHWLFFSLTKYNFIIGTIFILGYFLQKVANFIPINFAFIKWGFIAYTAYLVFYTVVLFVYYNYRILSGKMQ